MLSLYINGVAYNYPEPDEPPGWGDDATAWAVAVTQNLIPKNGGLFNLFGDVNFGSSNGLIAHYFKSDSLEPLGSVGVVRLAYEDVLSFRNATDTGDIVVGVNADGNLTVNGSPVGLPNPGPSGTYLYSDGTDVTWKQIDFSELSGNITSAQMNDGVGATSSTFFAGDDTWKAVGFDMLSGNIAVSQMDFGAGASASTYFAGDGTWKSFPGSNTQVLFRGGTGGVTTDSGFTYASTILTVGNLAVNGAAGRVSSTSGGLQVYSPSSQSLVLRAGVTNTSGPFPSSLNGQVLIEGNDVDITSNTTMNLDALNMRLGGADIDINAGQVDIQGDYGAKKVTVDSNGIGFTFDGKPLLINGSAGTSTWVLTSNGAGAAPSWQEVSATGVIPGADTQVLFNDGGVLGADAEFTYNKTTNVLTVPTLNLAAGGSIRSNGVSGASNQFLSGTSVWRRLLASDLDLSSGTDGGVYFNSGGGLTNSSRFRYISGGEPRLVFNPDGVNRAIITTQDKSGDVAPITLKGGDMFVSTSGNDYSGSVNIAAGSVPLQTAPASNPLGNSGNVSITTSHSNKSAGRIFIGTGDLYAITPPPENLLAGGITIRTGNVRGSATAAGSVDNSIRLIAGQRDTNGGFGTGGNVHISAGPAASSTPKIGGKIYFYAGGAISGSPPTKDSDLADRNSISATQRLVINDSGAFGLGSLENFGAVGQVLVSQGSSNEVTWSDINAPEVYSQATEPTGGISEGDIWFNTTTYNMYVYVGSAWVLQGQDDGYF